MAEEVSVKYAGRVNVVGLVLDVQNRDGSPDPDKTSFARDLMSDAGANFMNILPSDRISEYVMGNITVVPTTFFVDNRGNLVGSMHVGSRSLSDWSVIIDEML